MSESFDVVVLGAGPGGYPTAIRAAQLGLKVACVEREKLGGVCLNWGCIPSKALLKSAELANKIRHAEDFGLQVGELGVDFPKVVQRSRQVSERFERGVAGLFKKYGVQSVAGTGRLTGPGEVEVAGADGATRTLRAKHIVLATGARAKVFPGMEVDGQIVQTYREAIADERLPSRVVLLGSGAIGIEFAYFFRAMGAEVTVVEGLDEILPREDRELGREARRQLAKQGIVFQLGRFAKTVRAEGSDAVVVLADGTELRADRAIVALGVTPNIEDLGLEALGLSVERGFVAIDPWGRTNVPGLYAVGDLTTRGGLAHTATAQGHVLAELLAGHTPPAVRYDAIPSCTYCQPQVASVGLTEEAAKAAGREVKIGRFPFSANGKMQGAGTPEGFVKVLIDPKHGEIVGAHIVGADATELIAEFTLARTAELTTDELLHTVHAHPTAAEAMYEAVAQALGVSVHL